MKKLLAVSLLAIVAAYVKAEVPNYDILLETYAAAQVRPIDPSLEETCAFDRTDNVPLRDTAYFDDFIERLRAIGYDDILSQQDLTNKDVALWLPIREGLDSALVELIKGYRPEIVDFGETHVDERDDIITEDNEFIAGMLPGLLKHGYSNYLVEADINNQGYIDAFLSSQSSFVDRKKELYLHAEEIKYGATAKLIDIMGSRVFAFDYRLLSITAREKVVEKEKKRVENILTIIEHIKYNYLCLKFVKVDGTWHVQDEVSDYPAKIDGKTILFPDVKPTGQYLREEGYHVFSAVIFSNLSDYGAYKGKVDLYLTLGN